MFSVIELPEYGMCNFVPRLVVNCNASLGEQGIDPFVSFGCIHEVMNANAVTGIS